MSDLPPGFVLDTPAPAPPVAPGELPPGFQLDTPDALQGMTDTAARWSTFGLADPVVSAGLAAVQPLFDLAFGPSPARPSPEASFGERYRFYRDAERGKAQNFAAAHPLLNGVAAAAGGLGAMAPAKIGLDTLSAAVPAGAATRPFFANPGGPAASAGSIIGQMGTGAAAGAGIGAAGGLGESQASDPFGLARDAGTGAIAGGILGGLAPLGAALIAKPVSALARAMIPGAVPRQASDLIAGRIGQDTAAGAPGVPEIQRGLATAENSPLSIADLGGENVQALAGSMSRAQGEPRSIAHEFLGDRLEGMAPRLVQSIDANLSNGNAFQAAQDLIAQRRIDARPLYDRAFEGGSTAPLEHQFTEAFNLASREQTEAMVALNQARQQFTNATARGAVAGNVYSSSASSSAINAAKLAVQQAEERVATAQQAKEGILGRLRQAQTDGSSGAPGAVWNPRIQQFLDDPIMRQGITRGLQVQRLEALAENRPFNPREFAITGTDQSGNPIVSAVPNMRLLDAAKRGLDEILNDSRNPLTGQLERNQYVNAVDRVRAEYLKELDRVNPSYAAAREAWAGPTQALAAMRQGQNFREMRPELVGQTLGGMSPGEQDFFRLGAADNLRTGVGRTGTATPLIGANAVNQRGADYLKQQIRPLFPDQAAYERFINNASNENLIFSNTNKFIGNSLTAGRIAEDHGGGHAASPLANLIGGVSALSAGEPVAGTGLIARGLSLMKSPMENTNPAVRAAAARMLFSADPAQNAQTLARILATTPSVTPVLGARGASLAGAIYPQLEYSPIPFERKPTAPARP